MRPFFLLFPLLMVTLTGARIRSGEIVLSLGEAIDFDSGEKDIGDRAFPASPRERCVRVPPFAPAESVCRYSNGLNELAYLYSDFHLDCFGPGPHDSICYESFKSVFSFSDLYRFKKKDFYKSLDVPINISDTTIFAKNRLHLAKNMGLPKSPDDCKYTYGPYVSIATEKADFFTYYFLITREGRGCLFTVLKRDTVKGLCKYDYFNALKIKYYLRYDSSMDFSPIADEIRERIAPKKTYLGPRLSESAPTRLFAPSTFDILGRNRHETNAKIPVITQKKE